MELKVNILFEIWRTKPASGEPIAGGKALFVSHWGLEWDTREICITQSGISIVVVHGIDRFGQHFAT